MNLIKIQLPQKINIHSIKLICDNNDSQIEFDFQYQYLAVKGLLKTLTTLTFYGDKTYIDFIKVRKCYELSEIDKLYLLVES